MRATITDITGDKIAVEAPYNVVMIARARELEGKWHDGQWVFEKCKEGAVQAALDEIYLLPNNEFISIKITAKETISSPFNTICFSGFPVVMKKVGIKVPIPTPGVKKLSGKVYFSGAKITVEEASTFVLHDMSAKWIEVQSDEWEIEQFGEAVSDIEGLKAEIDRAEKRLAVLRQLMQGM